MEDKALTTAIDQEGWSAIIENLANEVGETVQERDNIVMAAECFVLGYSIRETAKKIGVTQQTVKGWLKQYPSLAHIIKNYRKLMIEWRIKEMDKQTLLALDFSRKLLLLDPTDESKKTDGRLANVQAQQARYILDSFVKNHEGEIQIQQQGSGMNLQVSQDAMSLLMDKLSSFVEQRKEPLQVIYEVDTKKKEDTPVFDRNGNPFYGEMRKIHVNEDGMQCHICGNYYKNFRFHIMTHHDLEPDIYCNLFMISDIELDEVEKKYAKAK